MSGQFRDGQHTTIEATDNEALAKRHGLTEFDEVSGQWRRPKTTPDTDERYDGRLAEALRENARLSDEIAERDAEIQQLKEQLALRAEVEQQRQTKATASKTKTSGSE